MASSQSKSPAELKADFQADLGHLAFTTAWADILKLSPEIFDASRHLRSVPLKKKHLKPKGEWNKLVVRAKGPRIQIWLNGYQTVDFTEADENIPLKGRFGLQIHSGAPAECWYRNLRLKKI